VLGCQVRSNLLDISLRNLALVAEPFGKRSFVDESSHHIGLVGLRQRPWIESSHRTTESYDSQEEQITLHVRARCGVWCLSQTATASQMKSESLKTKFGIFL